MKKKIIDGDTLVLSSPVSGAKYIRVAGINAPEKRPTNNLIIKEVKFIGKVKGIKEDVELSMNKKMFFEWINKIKQDALEGANE